MPLNDDGILGLTRALAATLLVALAAVAQGCTPSRAGDRIVVGVSSDVGSLLPVLRNSALDGEIGALLFLGLLSASWNDGALEFSAGDLALAETWGYGPDSTTLMFALRRDAIWSDGEAVTARDVVFTYELLRDPAIASPLVDTWQYLDSVVAVGDRQVAFHFQRRYPGMLFDTRIGIIPSHVFGTTDGASPDLTGHPALVDPGRYLVVSGAYRIAEWKRGERLVLAANPRAFVARPQVERVVFRIIPDITTRLAELEAGRIDVLEVSGPLSAWREETLGDDARWRVAASEDRHFDYVAWNGARFEPFSDPVVRRALSLGMDRGAMLEALGIDRYARPAAGPYPPLFRRVADPDSRPDPYLPDSALALLGAADWVDRDDDGVLDRGGRQFRFTLLTPAGDGRRNGAAAILQAEYAQLGIEMRIRQVEFNALLERVFERRDFEAVMLGWQIPLEHDYLVGHFWPADHPVNMTGYTSAALDSLIPLAQTAVSEAEATSYWRAAARVIAEDRPFAFLWYFDDVVIYSRRVKNVRIDARGLFQNLHGWRIES